MSDIFNTTSNRSSILSALRAAGTTGTVEDVLIPKRFRPPEDGIQDPKTAAEFLKKGKYRVLKPRTIPIHESVETELVLPNLAELVGEGVLKEELELPEGKTGYYPKYYPFHKPNHEEVGDFGAPDITLLKQVTYFLLQTDYESGPETLRELREAMATLQYGSGSYEGQLTRLIAMKDVALRRNPNKTPQAVGLTYEEVARLLEVTLPICQPADGSPPLTTVPSKLIDPATDTDQLPKITMKSSSGLPYVGKTKKDTLGEALALADTLLREISAASKAANPDAQLSSILEEFWYLSCGLLFPKAERYKQSEWNTKTRNIWSAPFPTHLLLSMISSPVMNNSKLNTCNFETPSLYALDPFHGNLDKIVQRMALKPDEDFYLVYADNIYIYQGRNWYSIDLEKGEANCTPEHMQAMVYYLLTRGWVDDDGTPAYNNTWATFAMVIAPGLVVDSSCLLMNLQLKTYGQGSGNAFTFLNNHLLSTIVLDRWEKAGRPEPRTQKFRDLETATGTNFKIERVLEDVPSLIEQAKLTAATTGMLADGTDAPPNTLGQTVDLDLLGWSAAYSRQLEAFVPILDRERLMASAAYPRGLENKDLKRKPGAEIAYSIIRYEALRLVGGWHNPLLETTLRHQSENLRRKMKNKGLNIDNYLEMWTTLSEFGDSYMDVALVEPLNNETLTKLNTPRETPPPEKPKVGNPTLKSLKEVSKDIATGLYKDPKSISRLRLLATVKTTLKELAEARGVLDALPEETDDWGAASERLEEISQISNKYNKLASSSLRDVREALERVNESRKPIATKTHKEPRPSHSSNPVVGYGLYSAAIPGLTKTQKKNAKRRSQSKDQH
uniref:RNA-directed RNA polymerase n=1 Tax=Wenling japanese topeshark birnavirus TaxID=2116469 RepID=A0A2P1GN63_9VIRU|nr:RNA-dependent RNA polymerase [Wenling japanese topeshark birnavirus]